MPKKRKKRDKILPGMYTVRYREDGKWVYARHETEPNKGKKCQFPSRQKAVQWIRNHGWMCYYKGQVCHPDGTKEDFEVDRYIDRILNGTIKRPEFTSFGKFKRHG